MTQSAATSGARSGNDTSTEVSESSPLLRNDSSVYNSTDSRSSVSSGNDLVDNVPPADHGRAAWLFLAGCFLIEGVIWGKHTALLLSSLKTLIVVLPSGLPFSYGVFQKYYTEHEPFSQEPQGIAAVGTTTTVSLPICFLLKSLTEVETGPTILPIACRCHSAPTMALTSHDDHPRRSSLGHSFACHCLFLDPSYRSYPHTGSTIWHWRSISVQPVRVLP